jgi:hypothetical protein
VRQHTWQGCSLTGSQGAYSKDLKEANTYQQLLLPVCVRRRLKCAGDLRLAYGVDDIVTNWTIPSSCHDQDHERLGKKPVPG